MNAITPIWFPYTQHKTAPEPLRVKSAQGCSLYLEDGSQLIDSISSWWCVIHGYNHPRLNEAVKKQLSQMSHVMIGSISHPAAENLAKKLVEITPSRLTKVFYGDSGSVGIEIALKMAIQYWQNQGENKKHKFLALSRAYHGDTTGAMSVCDPIEGMHALFKGWVRPQYFLPKLTHTFQCNISEIQKDIECLKEILDTHHQKIAAFIVEPIAQLAGGFYFYSPEYLNVARKLCDQYNILFIFDEVATGFGRTGAYFAANYTEMEPDIMVLGKGLTAGYVGHSATLATDAVFNAFYSDDNRSSFMHGPTFMGNPLACALGLESIALFESENRIQRIKEIETILRDRLNQLPPSSKIRDKRVMGAIGVVEVYSSKHYDGIQEFAAQRGVFLRPFGHWVYTMPPYVISDSELHQICDVIEAWFK